MRNDVITLISKSCTGATVSQKKMTVFAVKKSVRQSEFYAAQQVGLNPSAVFEIDVRDFETASEPTELIHNDKHYTIIRTYEKEETVEITVGVM